MNYGPPLAGPGRLHDLPDLPDPSGPEQNPHLDSDGPYGLRLEHFATTDTAVSDPLFYNIRPQTTVTPLQWLRSRARKHPRPSEPIAEPEPEPVPVPNLANNATPRRPPSVYSDSTDQSKELPRWRARVFHILHNRKESPLGRVLHWVFLLGLWISIANFCIATVSQITEHPEARVALFWIDFATTMIFVVELTMHIIASRSWRTLFTWSRVIDFMAIVPFFIEVIVSWALRQDPIEYSYSMGTMNSLRTLRVLRVFKFFLKSSKLNFLVQALYNSRDGILALVYVLPLIILFFGTMVFFAEQSEEVYVNGVWYYKATGNPANFQSIPSTFWFMMVTLTTIGYGDVVPQTTLGKMATIGAMVAAMFVVAFPLTMITTQYTVIVRKFNQKRHKENEWHNAMELAAARALMYKTPSQQQINPASSATLPAPGASQTLWVGTPQKPESIRLSLTPPTPVIETKHFPTPNMPPESAIIEIPDSAALQTPKGSPTQIASNPNFPFDFTQLHQKFAELMRDTDQQDSRSSLSIYDDLGGVADADAEDTAESSQEDMLDMDPSFEPAPAPVPSVRQVTFALDRDQQASSTQQAQFVADPSDPVVDGDAMPFGFPLEKFGTTGDLDDTHTARSRTAPLRLPRISKIAKKIRDRARRDFGLASGTASVSPVAGALPSPRGSTSKAAPADEGGSSTSIRYSAGDKDADGKPKARGMHRSRSQGFGPQYMSSPDLLSGASFPGLPEPGPEDRFAIPPLKPHRTRRNSTFSSSPRTRDLSKRHSVFDHYPCASCIERMMEPRLDGGEAPNSVYLRVVDWRHQIGDGVEEDVLMMKIAITEPGQYKKLMKALAEI
ncbi:uncharacterized protein BJ171DRAFT_513355 [Polychytrium aggregatum]|uniref:uncharacterized protein n=1 Tax=Polychytrium aggregatum TaxID=110093 RepID=UPI0022FE79C2|nr:uncharacterized protein BJ171DRAFT_513355 [Polychytrium aggregatum]KAI9202526.1 hypothetical protein BJ171DRAFT_513355 [Polychytrium aggregatum]